MLRKDGQRPLWVWGRRGVIVALMAGLAACSNAWSPPSNKMAKSSLPPMDVSASPRILTGGAIPKGGGYYKVGKPYRIAGQWHSPAEDPSYNETGVASWYGDDFHGRKTSNGELYDMYALTAAHRTLPMPSYVYVTNLANNRTVMLRVNDRGPYAHGRIIDLSKTAADALGVAHHGTGQVQVRYAGPAPMNGDDRRERQFLASQPWTRGGGPQFAAPAPIPARRPEFAANSDAYRPAALPQIVEPSSDQSGWSPNAYRAGQRSGLGR